MGALHSAQVCPGVPAPWSQTWVSSDQGVVTLCETARAAVTAVAEPVGKDWNVEEVAATEVWATVREPVSTPGY